MTYPLEQNNYILGLHKFARDEQGRPNSRIAAELFEEKYNERISSETIRRRWRESGLEMQHRGGARSFGSKSINSPTRRAIDPRQKYFKTDAKILNKNLRKY